MAGTCFHWYWKLWDFNENIQSSSIDVPDAAMHELVTSAMQLSQNVQELLHMWAAWDKTADYRQYFDGLSIFQVVDDKIKGCTSGTTSTSVLCSHALHLASALTCMTLHMNSPVAAPWQSTAACSSSYTDTSQPEWCSRVIAAVEFCHACLAVHVKRHMQVQIRNS